MMDETTNREVPPRRTRRVGTFTMGMCLIVCGVVLLLSVFFPELDLSLVGKLSPVILILLGIEVLAAYFTAGDNAKLQYDFASGVYCFILICGTMCLMAMGYALEYAGLHIT